MLIYLNGTSSSGKTSIALELQKLIPTPVFYFSIDTLLHSLASSDVDAIMGKSLARSTMDWAAIFSGYFSCVATLIKTENQVIADCPVYSQKLADTFSQHLLPLSPRVVVKIECPLEVLEEREKTRGDRAFGVAQGQFKGIHQYLNYDLQIHSHRMTPAESALKIFEFMNSAK